MTAFDRLVRKEHANGDKNEFFVVQRFALFLSVFRYIISISYNSFINYDVISCDKLPQIRA